MSMVHIAIGDTKKMLALRLASIISSFDKQYYMSTVMAALAGSHWLQTLYNTRRLFGTCLASALGCQPGLDF